MATELYLNPDNTVGGLDSGKVMVAPTQEEFEECCCKRPCEDCGFAQSDAVYTIIPASGGCTDSCHWWYPGGVVSDSYFEEPGTYDPGGCSWRWGSHAESLQIIYVLATGRWYAQMGYDPPNHYETQFGGTYTGTGTKNAKDITDLISCDKVTGKLAGAFDLDGLSPGGFYPDCTGCTAHVTLGG